MMQSKNHSLIGKKILITGAAGFIGSHLAEELLKIPCQVIGIDDLSSGAIENISGFKNSNQFTFVKGSVTDETLIGEVIQGVDIVLHQAAAKMTYCIEQPKRDLEINGWGTLNLLLKAREAGVKKFVHASTGSVYGLAETYPTDEKHRFNPRSFYGVSKLAGEQYVSLFNRMYGIDTTTLRYYHVFGPRQDHSAYGGVVSIFLNNAINKLPSTIYGDGHQERSFTFVKDLVRINLMAAQDPRMTGECYNCASGVNVSVLDLAKAIYSIYETNNIPILFEPEREGDIKHFDVSNEKLTKLGFEFLFPFEKGLEITADYYKELYGAL